LVEPRNRLPTAPAEIGKARKTAAYVV